MQGVEHDEAISICALPMQERRLLRRHCPSPLSPSLTPRNNNSEVFQQSDIERRRPGQIHLVGRRL